MRQFNDDISTNTNNDPLVVLGTSSKYRHALFIDNFPDIPFTHRAPDIDEKAIRVGNDISATRQSFDPHALTLAVAHAKADALLDGLEPNCILLTSDQVVMCNGELREKPQSQEQCRQFLKDYTKHPLQTISAVVITVVKSKFSFQRYEGIDVAEQSFLTIPDHIIDQLIEKGDVMYCAGGITVEDPILQPYLHQRKGSLDSIMGLPVSLVERLLQQAGLDIHAKHVPS